MELWIKGQADIKMIQISIYLQMELQKICHCQETIFILNCETIGLDFLVIEFSTRMKLFNINSLAHALGMNPRLIVM